jgi:hypothetical protein
MSGHRARAQIDTLIADRKRNGHAMKYIVIVGFLSADDFEVFCGECDAMYHELQQFGAELRRLRMICVCTQVEFHWHQAMHTKKIRRFVHRSIFFHQLCLFWHPRLGSVQKIRSENQKSANYTQYEF